MTATNPWLLVFVMCCTLQLSCFVGTTKSRGDSENFLWYKERQTRSLLDTGGKTNSDKAYTNLKAQKTVIFGAFATQMCHNQCFSLLAVRI